MKLILTNKQAIEHLRKFHVLDNCIVREKLELRELVDVEHDIISIPITLQNSEFVNIDTTLIEFAENFIVNNCVVETFNIYATYFMGGFLIKNNIIHNPIPFMHASHRTIGKPQELTGNTFNNFVDFEDTNFSTKVEIKNNNFKKGTNLLTEMQLQAFISSDSIIENNLGNLKISVSDSHILWETKK